VGHHVGCLERVFSDERGDFGTGGGFGVEEGSEAVAFVGAHPPSVGMDVGVSAASTKTTEREVKFGVIGAVHSKKLTHDKINYA